MLSILRTTVGVGTAFTKFGYNYNIPLTNSPDTQITRAHDIK